MAGGTLPESKSSFALTNASVVTGDPDGTVLPGTTVLVDAAGTIEQVGPSAEVSVPAGYRRIDVAGQYVLPGLINAHAHLFADGKPLPPILTSESMETLVSFAFHSPPGKVLTKRRAKSNILTQLHSGVTTLRSLGDVAYEVVAIRNEIEAGQYTGPRVLASGPLLAVSGGHGTPTIALVSDSPWAGRRNVRVNLRHGVDVIKIAATGGVTDARAIGEAGRPQMTEEEMAAICDEAHKAGLIVAAHAESEKGVKDALRAGVDTIEHGSPMDAEMIELFKDNPRSLRGFSALIPTLMAALPLVKLDKSITGVNDFVRENARIILDRIIRGVRDAADNGIPIGMGTDSALTYVTHYNTWREMDYVARYCGLSPARAFHAATQANARILGLGTITGSVEPGKAADLVVLRANPLDSFRAFTDPTMVIARGAIIENPAVQRFAELDAHMDSF
ncbi:MAG: amidohydrolase family protein [Actinobacteria bacterium]|nr:amidohydrolase family protein [Actinomycetota bacterium]